jgi:hypothetical protein
MVVVAFLVEEEIVLNIDILPSFRLTFMLITLSVYT